MLTFKAVFQSNNCYLREKLDVSGSLLPKLLDKKLLNDEHVQRIKSFQTAHEQVDKLLEILKRCDDEKLDLFCDALKDIGQTFIVKKLLADYDPKTEHKAQTDTVVEPVRPDAPPSFLLQDRHTENSTCIQEKEENVLFPDSSAQDEHIVELEEMLDIDYVLPDGVASVERSVEDVMESTDSAKNPITTEQHLSGMAPAKRVCKESTHVIPGQVIVLGVTAMKDDLFVLRDEGFFEVYSTETFELTRKFVVECVRDVGYHISNLLTSCETNNCLYVSHYREKNVYKVDLSAVNKPVKWPVDYIPRGLSVNKECNVIVTCDLDGTIGEYTPSGCLVRKLSLHQQSEVGSPWHAVELSNGHYAIHHSQPATGVSVLDREGRVLLTYRNDRSRNNLLWAGPCSLAVTADDCILVTDYGNRRIVILDSSLTCPRYIDRLSRDDQLERPYCIHFDKSRDRLFLGEQTGRVVVLDNVVDILH